MDSATLAQDLARAPFDGTLITSSHAQYERLRRANNGLIDRRGDRPRDKQARRADCRAHRRYDPHNLFRLNQNIEPRPWSAPK
ncbi:MAG TPA: hypothetical protein VFE34_15380 [Dongiaceae bacterium]|jgi:hypothetical protein|nr:hypothetical protein [Dongiaceae bacterium]